MCYYKIFHKEANIISLLDVVLISIPEVIVMYYLGNSFVEKKLDINNIMKISLVFGVCYYVLTLYISSEYLTVAIFLICTLLYYYKSSISLINCLILFSLSYGIKFVSEFTVITIATYCGLSIDVILSNHILKIIFCYMTLTIPIIIILINNKLKVKLINTLPKRKIRDNKNRLLINILLILASINILLITSLAVIINSEKKNLYSETYIYFMLIMMASIFCITVLIIITLSLGKSKEIAVIEKNLMANNLNQMQDTVDLLRVQRHDVMNHLQVILMQVTNGKNDDARRYILGLAEDVKNIGVVFDTGNNYIDAILNFKNRKCIDSQIELTACVDSLLENTKLDDTQLSSIFLNIIDNGIDELKKSKKEYKYIHVDTYYENNKHIISIKNNGSKIEDPESIFKIGVSSKGDNRGYGLYGIKQMLLAHKSSIEVISDEDETEFIIEIPIKKKDIEVAMNI